jgi:lysozyme family protein
MTYSFVNLTGEYTRRLAAMIINADQLAECEARAKIILERANAHDQGQVTAATGVSKLWWIASFEREGSSNYTTSPAQGDPINKKSTHIPRGLGPYENWYDAAIEAYHIDHLDRVGEGNWTWERACYEGEAFNGFGPRNHGRATGYLWSWSNQYTGGKYIRDNVWGSSAVDQQCGMIPLMRCLLKLDPSLHLENDVPDSWK